MDDSASYFDVEELAARLCTCCHSGSHTLCKRTIEQIATGEGSVLDLASLRWSGNGVAALASLPEALMHLKALRKLVLSGRLARENCTPQELPGFLCELPNLEVLHVANCSLQTCPPSLCKLHSSLRELVCCRNRLEVLPTVVCELTALQKLDVSHNYLSDLPAAMRQLTQLRELNLSSNPRLAHVPPVVGELHALERLRFMRCNALNSMPEHIASLPRLKELDVHETPLTLPPYALIELGGLEALRTFHREHRAQLWWLGCACERVTAGAHALPNEVLELISEQLIETKRGHAHAASKFDVVRSVDILTI